VKAYLILFASECWGCQDDCMTLRLSFIPVSCHDDVDLYSIKTAWGLRGSAVYPRESSFFLRHTLIYILTSEVGWPRPFIGVALHWVSNHMSGLVYKDVVCGLTSLILFHRAMVNNILCSYDSLSHYSYVLGRAEFGHIN